MSENPLSSLVNYFIDTSINYAKDLAADGTYGISKSIFASGVELGTYVLDSAAALPEYLINTAAERATGNNPAFACYKESIKPILKANNPFAFLNDMATKILAPEAYKFSQEHAHEGVSSFQAFDLIGPALLLTLSSKKTSENLIQTATRLKRLVMRENTVVIQYEISGQSKFNTFYSSTTRTETSSSLRLLSDASLSTLKAAGWGGLSFLTRQGMIRALVEAGNTEATAVNFATALTVASAIFPFIPAAWRTAQHLTTKLLAKSQEYVSKEPIIKVDGQAYSVRDLNSLTTDAFELPLWDSVGQKWNHFTEPF